MKLAFVVILSCFVHCSLLLGQWTKTNFNSDVQALASHNGFLFAGGESGASRSTDFGDTWEIVNNGLRGDLPVSAVYSFFTYGDYLFAGCDYNEGLFRSSDNGEHWERLFDGSIIMDFASSGKYLFISTNNIGIFRSIDTGLTWTSLDNGLLHASVHAILVKNDTLLAGDAFGFFYRSTNYGSVWTITDTDDAYSIIKDFAIHGKYVFVATDRNGIFRSSDNGGTWTSVSAGLAGKFVHRILVHEDVIFSIAGPYVYRSTNDGDSWQIISAGLPDSLSLSSILVKDNFLFIGATFGAYYGIWRRPLSDLRVVSNQENQWRAASNPFSNELTFPHKCDIDELVRLVIVDVLGREIYRSSHSAFDGERITINTNTWHAGTYYAHVSTSHEAYTVKLIKK